jgi:RHS repeat-associated protein
VSYSYDQTSFNGLTITNGKGRRTGMTDTSGETAWSYDPLGRVVAHRQTIGAQTKSILHTYNLDGSVASVTYPSGRVYSYSYDNGQHATALVDSSHSINFVTNAQYAAPGLLTSAIHGAVTGWNAVTETNSYNNRLQPTQFQAVSPVPLTLLNLSFSYDQGGGKNNGNVVQIANNRDSTRSVAYTYDQLNRLSTAKTYQATTWGNSYSYDPWSNLLQMTVTQGTAQSLSVIVNSNNQITTPAFNYDAAGHVTWDTVNSMKYDAEGRMNPTTGTIYTYDGNDRRVAKSDGTVYWVDDNTQPLSVGNTTSVTRDYIFFNNKRIGFVSLTSGNPYYYLSDHLNSTAVISSGDGKAIQWEADYFPFGSIRTVFTNLLDNHYLFTGTEYDYETGYDYAIARYLSGQFGRFLRPDPYDGSMDVADPQSLNRYTYVRNNAINLSDPLGLDDGCGLNCGGGDDGGCDFGCGGGDFGGGFDLGVAPPLNLTGPGFYGILGTPGFGVLPGQTPGLALNGTNQAIADIAQIISNALPISPPDATCDFGACGPLISNFQTQVAAPVLGTIACQILEPCGAVEDVLIVGTAVVGLIGAIIHVAKAHNEESDSKPSDDFCRQKKLECIDACSESSLPTHDNGFKFFNCVNRCLRAAGCLP